MTKTISKNRLTVALDEAPQVHIVDVNQGLEQQLVGYISEIPRRFLTTMLNKEVVQSNGLDSNLKLIRFVEERPHIMRTPVIISAAECLPVDSNEDLVSGAYVT